MVTWNPNLVRSEGQLTLTGDYTNYSAGNLRLFGGFFHDPRSGLADILFVDLRGKLMFYKAHLRPSLWVLPPSKVSYRTLTPVETVHGECMRSPGH